MALPQEVSTVQKVVSACICLHNLMRARYPLLQNQVMDKEDVEHHVIPGSWRTDAVLRSFRRQRGLNATTDAKQLILYLCEYYNAPNGAVSWQDRMI